MTQWLQSTVNGRVERIRYDVLASKTLAELNRFLHDLYESQAEMSCSCLAPSVPMHIRRHRTSPPSYSLVTNRGQLHAESCPRYIRPNQQSHASTDGSRRQNWYINRSPISEIATDGSNRQATSPRVQSERGMYVPSLEELNSAQRKAAMHKAGPCLVVAAAGSGKTAMAIERIKQLVQSGVSPSRILACTFTKRAAGEMKERLVKAIGKSARNTSVGTIHSIAYKMVFDELDKDWTVMHDPNWLIEQVLEDSSSYNPHGVGPIMSASDAATEIAKLKADARSPEQVDGPIGKVYAAFEAAKMERKKIDFEDMLLQATNMFQTQPEFAEKWQSRWDYVLVDEFQDSNQAQWLFLLELVRKTGNLFAIGDDWQSIYGFRGARPSLMREFLRTFPDAEKIGLTVNYRSHDFIVELGNRVIELNRGHQIHKTVRANRLISDDAIIQAIISKNDVEEARFVSDEIKQLRQDFPEVPYSNYAILYRTHIQSRVYEEALVDNDIPYQIIGDTHFYEGRDVKVILDYLRTTQDKSDPALWAPLLNRPKRFISNAVVKQVQSGGWEEMESHDKCKAFIKTMNQLEQHQSPSDAIRWLVDSLPGLIKSQDENDPIKWVDSLIDAASRHASIPDFLRYVDRVIERSKEPKQDAVQLMTIHKSKGLEFETVFVGGFAEGLLPHKKSIEDGDVREETRLCYVAITRAKQNLYLLSSEIYGTKGLERSRYFDALQG